MKTWILAALALVIAPATLALDLQLKGKTALVTGSTSNIGYSAAKALLKEGADVIVNGRTPETVNKAVETLTKETGRKPLAFVGDMTRPEDAAKLFKEFPRVDILVNNVGRMLPGEFTKTTDKDWYDSFELNVMTGVRLTRYYLPGMKERNWGRVIFISSESALQIPKESIQYGMTKAAQIAIARGLAESVEKTGITVNSILPGPTRDIDDPGTEAMAKRFGNRTPAQMEEFFFTTLRPTSLIKRFAHPDEVAALIVYVASPLSSATTGAALRVDGGVVKSAF